MWGWCVCLFSLRGQPLHNLLNVGAPEGGYRQDHPGGFHHVIELELLNEFGFSSVRLEIDLVGADQHGGGSNASVIQKFVELLLGLSELLRGGRVDDIQYHVAALGIPGPLAPVLFLPSYIPTLHIDLSFFKDLDVETDGRDGFDGFPVRQDGKERRLSAAKAMAMETAMAMSDSLK